MHKIACSLALTCTLAAAGSASGAVIYTENFTNSVNNSSAFSTFNWGSTYWVTGGVSNTTATSSTGVLLTSNAAGPQNTLAGVNNTGSFATPTNGAAGDGFAFYGNNTSSRMLAYTLTGVEYFGSGRTLNSSDLTSISIQTGSSGGGGAISAAVLVGSTWYVQTSLSAVPGTVANAAAFASTPTTFTWDSTVMSGSNWGILDTSVAGFSVGSAGALGSGNVNAVGFYYTQSTQAGGSQRFDNFTVSAVPEPASLASLAVLGALGFSTTRRRRLN